MPINFSGTRAPDRAQREVQTPVSTVRFSTDLGVQGFRAVPALVAAKRYAVDPDPKAVGLSPAEIASINTLDKLEAAVEKLLADNKDYFEAKDVDSDKNPLGVAGLRKDRLFQELRTQVRSTALPWADFDKALGVVNRLEAGTYLNRTVNFETGNHDTYHPYSDPFDAGVKLVQALAKEGVEKEAITNLLNYVVDRKTNRGSSIINERNLESSVRLRVIDRGNEGQTVSLHPSSTNPLRPQYVVHNVDTRNLPSNLEEHAGKAVFRDGNDYYFDKTNTKVPDELVAFVRQKAASSNLGLRAMEATERPRQDFPYDWNKNGAIDLDTINTSWWGHCHIQAALAHLGLEAGSSVTFFNAKSGETTEFNQRAVNDLLFAMYDADRYADLQNNQRAQADRTRFHGNRNDSGGAPFPGDKFELTLADGRRVPFTMDFDRLYEAGDSSKRVVMSEKFQPTVVDGEVGFKPNPAFQGLYDADRSKIDGNRKFVATIQYFEVSQDGEVKRQRRQITVDPSNPADEPVLLGTQLGNDGYPPSITKFYLNEKTGELQSQLYRPQKKDDGKYEMVPQSTQPRVVGKVRSTTLSHELQAESIVAFHKRMLQGIKEGLPFVADMDPQYAVWNYASTKLRMEPGKRDGNFEKFTVTLETQGRNRTFSYILKYNERNEPIDAHPLNDPPDFLWENERYVSAPLYRSPETGRLLYNSAAFERGYLTDAQGRVSNDTMAFFHYASDVVYTSMKDPSKAQQFVIRDEQGNLFFYDDKAAFEADVNAATQRQSNVA